MSGLPENPILIISSGGNAGQRCAIKTQTFLIGRDPSCELSLNEREISRHHAKITQEGERFILHDLESKNGTWVNGEQLQGQRDLEDGDEIVLGKVVRITFTESESTAPYNPENAPFDGKLRLERESRRVFVDEREVNPPLSLPQYRLLELLFDARGAICTRDQVVRAVWPDAISEGVSEQAIDALVRRLRDRIRELDSSHEYIVTARGHGFRLDNQT